MPPCQTDICFFFRMMADCKDSTVVKKKIEQLKVEEKLIKDLLADVRTEIDKYEVNNQVYCLLIFSSIFIYDFVHFSGGRIAFS